MVSAAVLAIEYTPAGLLAQNHGTTAGEATLIIDFGPHNATSFPGQTVTWSQSGGKWTYTVRASGITEYIFPNVSYSNNTAWSLMLAASEVMNGTTGSGLVFQKVYFPALGEFQITAIEGVHDTNSLFWQYTVNGQPAAYGVQDEKIMSGDTVSWSFSTA